MSKLGEGYKQVESFEGYEEGDYDEEVEYVTLDLGAVDPTLLPNASNYRLIGLETPTPFLQIGDLTFRGRYNELIGNELLFVNGLDEDDPSRRFITPLGTGIASEHRIAFREVTLVPKKAPGEAEVSTSAQETTAVKKAGVTTRGTGRGRGRGRGRRRGRGKDKTEASAQATSAEPSQNQAQDQATQGGDRPIA